MQPGQPSRTALGAAGLRAAHQVLDGAAIFDDPLALRILGADADDLVREAEAEADPFRQRLRWFIAARSRIADDALAAAVKRGARQLVVLGAGLDTTAYRHCRRRTCASSRSIIPRRRPGSASGWPRPISRCRRRSPSFRSISSARRWRTLAAAGSTRRQTFFSFFFLFHAQTFFTWLGVVPYLTDDAIFSTLGFIAGLPGGAHVVFDYVNPPDSMTEPGRRAMHEALIARVAAVGEQLRNHFDSDALHARLKALGFRDVEDFGWPEIAARFFPAARYRPAAARMCCARRRVGRLADAAHCCSTAQQAHRP